MKEGLWCLEFRVRSAPQSSGTEAGVKWGKQRQREANVSTFLRTWKAGYERSSLPGCGIGSWHCADLRPLDLDPGHPSWVKHNTCVRPDTAGCVHAHAGVPWVTPGSQGPHTSQTADHQRPGLLRWGIQGDGRGQESLTEA